MTYRMSINGGGRYRRLPGHKRAQNFFPAKQGFFEYPASRPRFGGVRFTRGWSCLEISSRSQYGWPDEGTSERAAACVIFENLNMLSARDYAEPTAGGQRVA